MKMPRFWAPPPILLLLTSWLRGDGDILRSSGWWRREDITETASGYKTSGRSDRPEGMPVSEVDRHLEH